MNVSKTGGILLRALITLATGIALATVVACTETTSVTVIVIDSTRDTTVRDTVLRCHWHHNGHRHCEDDDD